MTAVDWLIAGGAAATVTAVLTLDAWLRHRADKPVPPRFWGDPGD